VTSIDVSRRAPACGHELAPEPTILARVVADIGRELDAAGVQHAFLRGIATFPELPRGSDVDLCLRRRDLPAFTAVLELICARRGATIHGRFRAGFLAQFHLHAVERDGRHAFLGLDVHTAEAAFGVPFLAADELFSDRRDANGLRLPPPATSALVDFLTPYLSGSVVHERYASRLKAVLETRGFGTRARALARRLLGSRAGAALCAEIEGERHDALRARARRRRCALLARRFLRAPLGSLGSLAAFGYGVRLRPLWKPGGRFVVFLGTDGAGKTAVMEAVASELSAAYRGTEPATYHLRPGILPQLDRVVHLGRRTQGEADWSRPHRAAPSGRLLSNLRVAWYALDYFIGYALRVLPRRRRNALILFDRYFYDYLVDPQRCRVRPGTLLVRLLAPLVPRPDAVIVISADLEQVQARKQELAPEESARQIADYEQLAARGERWHLVRNDGLVEEAVDSVLRALFVGRAA